MQLQEAHRHRQLNGQESQGLKTRLSRCFFLTRDQDRWKLQLFTIVRISGSSVSLRRNSLNATQWIHDETVGVRLDSSCEDDAEGAEHRGCCIRNAHCDSESHRQEMGQLENNDRYLRQMGEFQTVSDELSDVKEQLRVASPTEGDDPEERSKHGVPRQQDLTQQQPQTESPPQKQHVSPQSSSQPLKQQSRKDPRPQQFQPEPRPQMKHDAPRQQPVQEQSIKSRDQIKNHSNRHDRINEFEDSPTVDDGRGKRLRVVETGSQKMETDQVPESELPPVQMMI